MLGNQLFCINREPSGNEDSVRQNPMDGFSFD